MRSLRVALAQINPTVGDLPGNTQRILDAIDDAEAQACDLVAFPELAITGYPPEDLLLRRPFVHENLDALQRVQDATVGKHVTAIVGFVDLAPDAYNAAAVLHDGHRAGVYHKQYLPNYGVFDENRYFRPGTESPVFSIAGVPVGVSICEDIWYSSGPVQAQALAGAEVVVNINGSPFHAGKIDAREKMLATRAADNAVIVCYCNMLGGQDSLIFDGGSMIHGPRGERLATAPMFEDALLVADLDVEAVGQVRLHDPRLRRLAPERPVHIPVSEPASSARPARAVPPNDAYPPSSTNPSSTNQDDAAIYQALVLGTRDYVHKTGFEKVVIALSGGIDSTLTATIAADALGAANVVCVAMPSRYSSEGSVGDAHALAENLGIELLTIPIEGPFTANLAALHDVFADTIPDVAEENLQARVRGTLIMALSNKFGWLVLTTSNKSESATGYTTLYGDMTGGLAVIQDVLKTTVYRLARYVNDRAGTDRIPVAVIDKPPSAELRPDQRDEDSLMPYDRLDPILQAFVEEDRTRDEIVAQGFDPADVERVMTLVTRAEYKRRQAAPGLKITPRAFGKDRRFPIANAYRGF